MAADNPNRVYFISYGPCDPDLMTVRGLRALEVCGHVLAPSQFSDVFPDYVSGKEVESPFTMERATLIEWVEERLARGSVAFMVPGDFTIFCPFQSFAAYFGERAEVVPGVSSHVAAAAILKKTFDLPGLAYATIITSPRAYTRDGDRSRFAELAGPGKTLVLYMNDLPIDALVQELLGVYPPATPIAILEQISCPDQQVTVSTLERIEDDLGGHDPFQVGSESPEPSLALVVVGDIIAHDEDPKWWDHRYNKIWKPRSMR